MLVAQQVVHVVVEGAHPGRHLFLFGAGQKADVLAHGDRRSGEHHPFEALGIEGLLEGRGQGHEGLAGTGTTSHRDQVHGVVHQQVQGEILPAVVGVYSPDAGAVTIVGQKLQGGLVGGEFAHDGLEAGLAVGVGHQHAQVPVLGNLAAQAIDDTVMVALDLDVQRHGVPQATAGVLIHSDTVGHGVGVIEGAIGQVVLDRHAEGGGLDPQVDVLGDQDHRGVGAFLTQSAGLAEQTIVGAVFQVVGQGEVGVAEQSQSAIWSADAGDRNTLAYLVDVDVGGQVREGPADLPGGAGDFADAILVLVELLEHGHGDNHFVLFELVEGAGIMDQYVGVQHVQSGGLLVDAYHRHSSPDCHLGRQHDALMSTLSARDVRNVTAAKVSDCTR